MPKSRNLLKIILSLLILLFILFDISLNTQNLRKLQLIVLDVSLGNRFLYFSIFGFHSLFLSTIPFSFMCCRRKTETIFDDEKFFIFVYFSSNGNTIIYGIIAYLSQGETFIFLCLFMMSLASFICTIISFYKCCKGENICTYLCTNKFLGKLAKYPLMYTYLYLKGVCCSEPYEFCVMFWGYLHALLAIGGAWIGFYIFFFIFILFWLLCKMFVSLGECCKNSSNEKNKGYIIPTTNVEDESADFLNKLNIDYKENINPKIIENFEERESINEEKSINDENLETR